MMDSVPEASGPLTRKRYFCHECNMNVVPVRPFECPRCNGGFVEEIEEPVPPTNSSPRINFSLDSFAPGDNGLGEMFAQVASAMMQASGYPLTAASSGSAPTTIRAATIPGGGRIEMIGLSPGGGISASSSSADPQSNSRPNIAGYVPYGRPPYDLIRRSLRRDRPRGFRTLEVEVNVMPRDHPLTSPYPNRIMESLISGGFGGGIHYNGEPSPYSFNFGEVLHANPGDYVWGPGGLDAVLSNLINTMDGAGAPPMTADQIDQIESVTITAEEVISNMQCSVCMEDFKEKDSAKKLSCKHLFHIDCITPWLGMHDTCPICRKTITIGNPNGSSSSSGPSAGAGPSGSSTQPNSTGSGASPTPPSGYIDTLEFD